MTKKKLTIKEVNSYIHSKIMDRGCWHDFDWDADASKAYTFSCINCGEESAKRYVHPYQYCSDGAPRIVLYEVMVELIAKVGICEMEAFLHFHQTAEQIARACVEAHKSLKGK